ncbi:MipA/OmpV family protein [Ruegeria sp.]|uniref:MipA/OmpV family protein n=1 Tax=Ruegeria sp. TaxID=1879320 RepID=UPI0023274C0A|nr:MipA/OmpV family protein [Ruegeria sp.]MDA7964908.1 MipA/OmpV family protein [Ruegeria sp.]
MTKTWLNNAAKFMLCAMLSTGASQVAAQGFDDDDDDDDGGNWEFFLGAGAEYEPEYEGSDRYTTEFQPGFQIVYKDRLLISPQGIGAFIVNQDRLRIQTAIGYGGGRNESDSPDLAGLGDIDDGAVFAFGAQYDLTRRLAATVDVEKYFSGSEGTLVTLGLQTQVPFGVVRGALLPTGVRPEDVTRERGLALFGGVSVDWADTNYNQSFFGISAAQSAASGLSQFSAGSGFKSVNAEIGFLQPLGKGWGLTGAIGYSRLLGDAVDSPIVKSRDAVTAELAVGFRF